MAVVTWTSGAYTDHDAAELSQMGTWRGRAMDVAAVFPSRDNAGALANSWYLASQYSGGAPALAVAVPMCYTGGSLSQDLTAPLTTMANSFNADGRFFYIRLGWEFNLPQWPWAVTDSNVTTWKSRFSQYANIFKNILGNRCSIGLNPNIGANQSGYSGTMLNLLGASSHIEWAGPDAYDAFPPFNSDPNVDEQFTTTQGLDFWTDFCQDNGIQLALPEYGVSSGTQWAGNCGNDNPRFITEILQNWLGATPDLIAFDCYFNEPASYVESDIFRKTGDGTANNPNSGIRYQEMFEGGNQTMDASTTLTLTTTATLTGGSTTLAAELPLSLAATASLTVSGDELVFPDKILPIKTEIEVDNGWVDITSRVRSDAAVTIIRGTPDESGTPEPATMTLSLNNRDGLFSPRNPMSAYYGKIGRNTPIRCSVESGGYAQITQETTLTEGTCSVSAPDTPGTSVTGDIDIRFDADLTSWRDSMSFYGKWTTTGNQRSYVFYLRSDGTLAFGWSSDGATTAFLTESTAPVPITAGRLAVRVTLDVNNGASGNTTTFYYGDSLDGPWTQLGDPEINSGTTSIFNSTASSYLLDNPTDGFANSVIHGRIYGARVYSGIAGTLVSNPDFTGLVFGTTSFVDSTTNTWTVNSLQGSLEIRDFDIRFTGEVSEWPQAWDTSGNDVFVPLKCADIRRRLSQGAAPLQSPIRRSIANMEDLLAYWPAEDQADSTGVASGLSHAPMKISGDQLSFAADETFLGSEALPQFNGAMVTGAVPPYAGVSNFSTTGAVQVRFLLHVPSNGTINGAQILRINHHGGTIAYWLLTYGSGGSLSLVGKDKTDATVAGTTLGPIAFDVNDRNLYVSVELNNNVGPSITARVKTLEQGETTGNSSTITVSSRSITKIASVQFNASKNMQDVSFGHVTVESEITSLFDIGTGPLSGFLGETAGIRIIRLSRELGVPIQSGGFSIGSTPMGVQDTNTYLELIQECADADGGILFSPRDWLAIAYRPQDALMAQPADLTLDYSAYQLQSLEPVEDDQSTRNDITVVRTGGSSARAVDTTSSMSVNAPPLGVGTYADTIELHLESDSQLANQAGWRLRLGTVDEARYPVIDINLASPNMDGMLEPVAAVDIGSRLVVENPPMWVPPDDISQVIRGYTEILSQFEWRFSFNCTPSSPYDTVGVWGESYKESRYSSDGSYLANDYSSSATTFNIDTPVGPMWTEDAGDFPFDMIVAGERVTVTDINAVSGTIQAFVVTRSVNGVVKAQDLGAEIKLFNPSYYTP